MKRFLYLFLSASTVFALALFGSCTAGDDDDNNDNDTDDDDTGDDDDSDEGTGSAPEISNLGYSPKEINFSEIQNNILIVNGSFYFKDEDGDFETVNMTVVYSDGRRVPVAPKTVSNVAGIKEGGISVMLQIPVFSAGEVKFEIIASDKKENESNTLTGAVDVVETVE